MKQTRFFVFILLAAVSMAGFLFGGASPPATEAQQSQPVLSAFGPRSSEAFFFNRDVESSLNLVAHILFENQPQRLGLQATATPQLQTWYVTNAQRVNMRSCGGMGCAVVVEVEYGQSVYVIPPVSGEWQLIRLLDGTEGYIWATYISRTVPPAASPTLPVVSAGGSQTRYATAEMNLRSCAGIQCSIVGRLVYGQSFIVTGQTVDAGGSTWYSLTKNGQTMWGAGWLTSPQWPGPSPTPRPLQQSAPPVLPQQPAQAQPTPVPVIPTPIPVQIQPPQSYVQPPQESSYACNCSKTCSAMASCAEAYYQLNECGCGRRDGDNDGVPCEEICPGG